MHATGFGLGHDAPARSPMANGSTRAKGSELPSKEHCREEHSENATFPTETQRNVAKSGKSGGEMTDHRLIEDVSDEQIARRFPVNPVYRIKQVQQRLPQEGNESSWNQLLALCC